MFELEKAIENSFSSGTFSIQELHSAEEQPP